MHRISSTRVKMADSFVREKLRQWSLEMLLETFTENAIDEESFGLLDPDSIKELIPKVGLRVKFINYHKKYMQENLCNSEASSSDSGGFTGMSTARQSDGSPALKHRKIEHGSPETLGQSSSKSSVHPYICPQVMPAENPPMKPWQKPYLHFNEEFDIRSVLLLSREGQDITTTLDTKRWIAVSQRRQLVRILVDHLVTVCGEYPKSSAKIAMAKALITQFPCLKDCEGEGYEAWFTPSSQSGHSSAGYLEERLRNIRKRNGKLGREANRKAQTSDPNTEQETNSAPRSRVQRSQQRELVQRPELTVSPEELSRMQTWLMDNMVPLQQVHEYMKATAPDRLRWRLDHPDEPIANLLKKYPRLLDTPGMIDQDFYQLYPDHTDMLRVKWTNEVADKLLRYADAQQKFWPQRLGITKTSSEITCPVERTNIALQVLPFILPANLACRGRASTDTAAKAFIDVQPEGTDPQAYLNNAQDSDYPFILLIGNRISPAHVFVIFQESAIVEVDLLKAVDECFKLFHTLGVSYPSQCQCTWEFIQKFVYELVDPDGRTSSAVRMLRTYINQQDHP